MTAKQKSGEKPSAKEVIYTRFSPDTIAALDQISEAHPLKPTRARLIEAAVAEYIARYRRSGKKG